LSLRLDLGLFGATPDAEKWMVSSGLGLHRAGDADSADDDDVGEVDA